MQEKREREREREENGYKQGLSQGMFYIFYIVLLWERDGSKLNLYLSEKDGTSGVPSPNPILCLLFVLIASANILTIR